MNNKFKWILTTVCVSIATIMIGIFIGINISSRIEKSQIYNKLMDLNLTIVDIAIFVIFIVIFVILLGFIIYNSSSKYGYFDDAIKNPSPNDLINPIKFYMKKHMIFRYFAIGYSTLHHLLNILAVIFSMIAIYIILDSSNSNNNQAIFLFLSAISTSLIFGLRLDRAAEGYAHAMRIMEKSILSYLANPDGELQLLYDANDEAEKCIENKFF